MAGRWEHRHRWSLDLTRTRHGWVLNGSCTRCGEHLAVPVPARLLTRLRASHDRRTPMSEPVVIPVTVNPRFPLQRVLRTAVQVLSSLIATLAVIALIAPQVLDALKDVLPASWLAWLAGAFAFVTLLSAALAKIMAIPAVNELLTKIGLGSVPSSVAKSITPGVTLRRDLDDSEKEGGR